MKYIMFESRDGETVKRMPIIFPNELVHKEVARFMTHLLLRHDIDAEPVTAGTISVSGTCSGESETLKLHSEPEDSEIINNYDYFHGLV